MNLMYSDYGNSIANLACSILKVFGVEPENPTLKLCDELFDKEYKNVVVLLLDGMGKAVMDKNLEKDGFYFKHLRGTYSSVFPPTTVAATVSMYTGLYPAQHSWLGWDCYYKEIDKNVTVFLNTVSETGEPAADYNVAQRYCPYTCILEKIKAAGYGAYEATPFAAPYPEDFGGVCERIKELCGLPGRKYIYGYWNEPDHTMHYTGCDSEESKKVLKELEKETEKLCGELSDTLLIVTADHGHLNCGGALLTDYPGIMECLVRMPSIEPRAINFFIKPGFEKQFEAEFTKEFGDKFILYTKKQVKETKLFGPGSEHERFDEMLGDYLAAAVSDLAVYNSEEEVAMFKSVHAGMTDEEMIIPLIGVKLSPHP